MQNTGLIRRLAAIIYDALLLLAFLIIVALVFNATQGGQNIYTGSRGLVLAYELVRVSVIYLFFVGYWSTRGRTLGMQSWGLQLLNRQDQVPTVSESTIRFGVAILSWACLGLGFLWQLWDPQKLTWHDRASGTRLVHIPKSEVARKAGSNSEPSADTGKGDSGNEREDNGR